MKVEVLASVMNASLPETVQHMNLQSDAVIINQCDRLGQEEMQISPGNGRIRFCSFPDRGIGRSRNEAILRAEGDICLFHGGVGDVVPAELQVAVDGAAEQHALLGDRKSTRLNSSHNNQSRMPSSA